MHVDNQFPLFPQKNLNIWIPKLHDSTLPSSSKKMLPIFHHHSSGNLYSCSLPEPRNYTETDHFNLTSRSLVKDGGAGRPLWLVNMLESDEKTEEHMDDHACVCDD